MAGLTYQQFVERVYDDLDFRSNRTYVWIEQATVRALKDISSNRILPMEATATFSTVASQGEYDTATSGFPKDAQEFTHVFYTVGVQDYEIPGAGDGIGHADLRFEDDASTTEYPRRWAFYASKLWLRPKPSGVITVKLDYFRDATRDTATGNEIASVVTTPNYTNPWFDVGQNFLYYTVLGAVFKSPTNMDQERAAFCDIQAGMALKALREQLKAKKPRGGQADMYMDGPLGDATREYRRYI